MLASLVILVRHVVWSLTHYFWFRFCICFPVVFGSVVEGMDVVKSIEAVGSGSGATRSKVEIADCGQL